MWKSNNSSLAPWKIRRTISAYAPQFVGYQQHDAQELLGFMLDRIHEDLNQVKKKPYFEDSDIDGETDFEKARESWRRHSLRNQSIVVDLMHGQYKSSVVCPECKKCSITFDPFNSITLPLPQSQEKTLSFYYIFYDCEKVPFNMLVEYSQGQTIEHLRKEVSKILGINENNFMFASILNDSIKELVKDSKTIESLKNFTIFAYEFRDIEDFETIELLVGIDKAKNNKVTSYSRIININKNSNFKELHFEILKKFRKHFPKMSTKLKIQENYEDFLQNPAYFVNFAVNKETSCQFCKERNCKGCPIPYSNEKIKRVFNGNRVIIEAIWRSSHQNQGANISDLNRCTEHESVSEVLQRSKKVSVKLEDCFELFRVPEKLEKENAWFCTSCHKHVLATKKLEIYKVPPILIIHIKRFRVNGHSKEKLYNPVIFPETGLDIRSWVIGNEETKLYDLYAVCNHFGNLAGGHYTASCYSTLNKKWFDFKDSQVVPSTDTSHSASAYVLFYRARK
jgi:ubiquitin carboxyl-terminal hydrolase 4/11/15